MLCLVRKVSGGSSRRRTVGSCAWPLRTASRRAAPRAVAAQVYLDAWMDLTGHVDIEIAMVCKRNVKVAGTAVEGWKMSVKKGSNKAEP